MNVLMNGKVPWAGLLVCLALVTGFTTVRPALAGSFFSSSRYAYFAGTVGSWDRDPSVDSVFVITGPINSVPGDDPFAFLSFDSTVHVIVIEPGSTECYLQSTEFDCNIANFLAAQLDYGGKDFYGSGVWKITENLWLVNANITNIQHYVNGFHMIKMVVCIESNTASEAFIKEITTFAAEANIKDITAYIAGIEEWGLVDPIAIAEDLSAYATDANVTNLTLYVQGINYTDPFTPPYCDIIVSYCGTTDVTGEPRANFVQITHQEDDSPGELYVVGNWTDFTANIKGLGVVTGKVTDHVVKNESPTVPNINVKVDINHDGKINIVDVAAVARVFGCTKDTQSYNPLLDINSDYIINILDLSAVATDFGTWM